MYTYATSNFFDTLEGEQIPVRRRKKDISFRDMLRQKFKVKGMEDVTFTSEPTITVESVKSKCIFIGTFDIEGDLMPWTPAQGLKKADVKRLGDLVYFMIVGDKIYKIGKAGGANGFVGRSGTYQAGKSKHGDRTNRKIMSVMEDIGETRIEPYAIPIPKARVTFYNPFTEQDVEIDVSCHSEMEKYYTKQFLNELGVATRDLPFCHQLK